MLLATADTSDHGLADGTADRDVRLGMDGREGDIFVGQSGQGKCSWHVAEGKRSEWKLVVARGRGRGREIG